jgi:hypothetical protein
VTITRDQARPRTKALVLAMRDVLSNEEAWDVAQSFLDAEREDERDNIIERQDQNSYQNR